MKKIFIALSSVLLAAACAQFEKETAPVFSSSVAAPTIERVADETLDPDHAFSVKVTPGADNIYYAFAIIPGDKEMDGETLLTDGYAKSALTVKVIREEVEVEVPLSGCFLKAKLADTTLVAPNLTPNSKYTVYAVGSGEKGVVSLVKTLTITTSDETAPDPYNPAKKSYSFDDSGLEDGTIVINFGDPIKLTDACKEGKASFYATYSAVNDFDAKTGDLTPQFVVEIPLDSISVSGSKVSIQVPERIPGAVVSISYDAEVVVNGVGTMNPALAADECGAYWKDPAKQANLTFFGIAGRFETAEFDLDRPMILDEAGNEVKMPADTVIYFNNWKTLLISLTAPDLVEPRYQKDADNNIVRYNAVVPAGPVQIRYTDANNRKIIYDNDIAGVSPASDSTVVILLAEEPDFGSSVSVDVPAGSVEDIWGNTSTDFSTAYIDEDGAFFAGNYFYSYGLSVTDFCGTYSYAGIDSDNVPHVEAKVVIAPDPKVENGILVYDLFKSLECWGAPFFSADSWAVRTAPLKGVVNIHDASIAMANAPIIDAASAGLAGYGYEGVITVEYDDYSWYLQLDVTDGSISTPSPFYYILGPAGWWSYEMGKLTRISDDYTVSEGGAGGAGSEGGASGAPRVFRKFDRSQK